MKNKKNHYNYKTLAKRAKQLGLTINQCKKLFDAMAKTSNKRQAIRRQLSGQVLKINKSGL